LQGLTPEIIPSKFEENLNPNEFSSVEDFVIETAYEKTKEVAHRLGLETGTELELIIGADTVVSLNGKIFGKPGTSKVAFETLTE